MNKEDKEIAIRNLTIAKSLVKKLKKEHIDVIPVLERLNDGAILMSINNRLDQINNCNISLHAVGNKLEVALNTFETELAFVDTAIDDKRFLDAYKWLESVIDVLILNHNLIINKIKTME